MAVPADVGSAMAAAASFSWGVFTSDSPQSIPDVNSVFQWYGSAEDGGNTLELDVLFREYTFKPTAKAGPVFADSRFTIESAIRRCFDTAARASVKKLLSSYNDKIKDLIKERMAGGNEKQREYFKSLFNKFNDDGVEKSGGMVLLEPYDTSKQNPAVNIEGVEFHNQGSRNSKRIRLVAMQDGDPCPVTVKLNIPNSLGVDIDYDTISDINPYVDMRLLAGNLQYGNPKLFQRLQQFINHLDSIITFPKYDSSYQKARDEQFPTVLFPDEIKEIVEKVIISKSTCFSMVPFYGNVCLNLIEQKVKNNLQRYTESIRRFLSFFDKQTAIAFNYVQTYFQNDDPLFIFFTKDETDRIKRQLIQMQYNPILWINGPLLQEQHYNDKKVEIEIPEGTEKDLSVNYRLRVLEGFDVDSLRNRYLFDVGNKENIKKFKTNFDTQIYDIANYLSMLNTLDNIISTEKVAVKWDDWKKCRTEKYEQIEASVADAEFSGVTKTSERPFFRSVIHHAQETRYRLSILDDDSLPSDVNLQSGDIDIDAAFKNFEYDMHVGNDKAYMDEILTVVRLALECILIPVETVVESEEEIESKKVLGEDTSVLRIFPELGGDGGKFKRTLNNDEEINALNTSKVSAASYFVYQHILKSYTTPFNIQSRNRPNYDEIMSLLASLNPFPLKDNNVIKFVQNTMKKITEKLRTKFEQAYHLVQHMENSRPNEIQQPFTPYFVQFSRTTNEEKLNWSVGSETTWMLEGIVLALNLVNMLTKKTQKNDFDYDGIENTPFQMDLNDKNFEEVAKSAIERTKTSGGIKTNRFTINGKFIYKSKEYFENFLGLDSTYCGLQVGRFVLGEKPKGPVGWFKMNMTIYNEDINQDIKEFLINFKTYYQNANSMVEKSNYDRTGKPFLAVCIDDDRGQLKRVGFCSFNYMKKNLTGRGLEGPKINDGTARVNGEVVNFLQDIDMIMYKGDILERDENNRDIVTFKFVPKKVFFTIQTKQNTEFECFKIDQNALTSEENIRIEQKRDVYDTNVATQKIKLTKPSDYVPFQFKKAKTKINVDELVETLMGNFKGLHYSNMKSLRRTVMAMAVKDSFPGLTKWLNKSVSVYSGTVPWAVNSNDESQKGSGMLLYMLCQAFENSTTRATDSPMADRVIVRCKGPGAADEPTPCYLENWYYRTAMFFQIEVKVMSILSDLASRFKCQMPVGTVVNPIAKTIERCKNIHEILNRHYRAAPAICKLMINVYEFEKVGHRSKGSRDKAALKIQSETIMADAHYILFRI